MIKKAITDPVWALAKRPFRNDLAMGGLDRALELLRDRINLSLGEPEKEEKEEPPQEAAVKVIDMPYLIDKPETLPLDERIRILESKIAYERGKLDTLYHRYHSPGELEQRLEECHYIQRLIHRIRSLEEGADRFLQNINEVWFHLEEKGEEEEKEDGKQMIAKLLDTLLETEAALDMTHKLLLSFEEYKDWEGSTCRKALNLIREELEAHGFTVGLTPPVEEKGAAKVERTEVERYAVEWITNFRGMYHADNALAYIARLEEAARDVSLVEQIDLVKDRLQREQETIAHLLDTLLAVEADWLLPPPRKGLTLVQEALSKHGFTVRGG